MELNLLTLFQLDNTLIRANYTVCEAHRNLLHLFFIRPRSVWLRNGSQRKGVNKATVTFIPQSAVAAP